ncbi:hypothetical protein EDD17DRAFT_1603228 [Pisolithus thermaeus]|nr:hypothetical protein EDD17DRAFT_1603228 [Pisolithus thermaeus]
MILPDIVIQLYDAHPTLANPGLLRVLLYGEDLLARHYRHFLPHQPFSPPRSFGPVPVPLIEHLVPRHMQIIYDIVRRHFCSRCHSFLLQNLNFL